MKRAPIYIDILTLGTLLFCGILVFNSVSHLERFEPDSSYYMGLAQALLDTGVYKFNFAWHTKFPPGFPSLIAVVWVLFGTSYATLAKSITVIGTAALILSYRFLARLSSRSLAACSVILLATSPYYFNLMTQQIRSDVPFFFVTILVLYAVSVHEHVRNPILNILNGATIVIGIGSAIMLRISGAALLVGAFAVLLPYSLRPKTLPPRLKPILLGAFLGALSLSGWIAWSAAYDSPDWQGQYMHSYLKQITLIDPHRPELGKAGFSDIALRLPTSIAVYCSHFAAITFRLPWVSPIWYSPIVFIPALCALIGLWKSRTKEPFVAWYTFSYLGIYSLWPFDEGPRFLFPVYVLFFLYVVRGAFFAWDWFTKEPSKTTRSALTLSTFLLFGSVLAVVTSIQTIGNQAIASCLFWLGTTAIISLRLFGSQSSTMPKGIKLSNTENIKKLSGYILLPLLVSIAAGAGISYQISAADKNAKTAPSQFYNQRTVVAANWLSDNIPTDAIVMASPVSIVHRICKRRVVDFPVTSDTSLLFQTLKSHSVDYLVVHDQRRYPYFFPTEVERLALMKTSFPNLLELEVRLPKASIYKVDLRSTASTHGKQ